jgi:hypothetical protein
LGGSVPAVSADATTSITSPSRRKARAFGCGFIVMTSILSFASTLTVSGPVESRNRTEGADNLGPVIEER